MCFACWICLCTAQPTVISCPAGREDRLFWGTCEICAAGTYKAAAGTQFCEPCPSGTYGDGTGLTQCTPCPGSLNSPPGSKTCKQSYDIFLVLPELYNRDIRKMNMGTTELSTISTTFPQGTNQIAISPDGGFAFVVGVNAIWRYRFASGAATFVAGSNTGAFGTAEGSGASARFDGLKGLAFSPDGTYVLACDVENNRIRKITMDGTVSTIAGRTTGGYAEGSGTDAVFSNPSTIDISPSGNFAVVSEYSWMSNRLRKLDLSTTPVTTSLLAGSAAGGDSNGVGSNARFNQPDGVAVSPDESVCALADYANRKIRIIQLSTGLVSTLYTFSDTYPSRVQWARLQDYILVLTVSQRIWKLMYPSGSISLVAGGGSTLYPDNAVGTLGSISSVGSMQVWPCNLPGYGSLTSSDVCIQCPAGTTSNGKGVCNPICSQGTFFNAQSTCSACSTCWPGTYIAKACSAIADTVCACLPGSFLNAQSTCTACSTCGPGTYTATACSASADAVCLPCGAASFSGANASACTPCISCTTGNYASTPCTPTSQTVCTPCISCEAGSYASTACSPTSQTVCTPCITCPADTYRSKQCTSTSQTECTPCITCSAGQFTNTPCSPVTQTVCEPCVTCILGVSYISKTCTTTSQTECMPCISCGAGKYTAIPCSLTAQSVCIQCITCPADTYTSRPCTATSQTECTACITCPANTYTSKPCTSTSQTECTACITCATGYYASTPCTSTSQTVCTPCTTCAATLYASSQCTSTTNTVCSPCPAGTFNTADSTSPAVCQGSISPSS
jgi:hypothetical protein